MELLLRESSLIEPLCSQNILVYKAELCIDKVKKISRNRVMSELISYSGVLGLILCLILSHVVL